MCPSLVVRPARLVRDARNRICASRERSCAPARDKRERAGQVRSGLLDGDLLLALLRFRRLRQGDRKHAVLKAGFDLVTIDAVRHAERTLERAIAAFGEVIILLLLFLFLPFL